MVIVLVGENDASASMALVELRVPESWGLEELEELEELEGLEGLEELEDSWGLEKLWGFSVKIPFH